MIYASEVKVYILNFLEKHNLDIKLKYLMDYKNALGYNVNDNTINFNDYEINLYHKKFPNLSTNELLNIMLSHEIGHYIDYKNNINRLKHRKSIITQEQLLYFRIISERAAWEYGLKFVEQHLVDDYNKLNQDNLKKYKV